jgi:hypothetical protein
MLKGLETQDEIQIGLPRIAGPKSRLHFSILRQWLRNCDENHARFKCRPPKPASLPTRLIDVGQASSDVVRLRETQDLHGVDYVALSHPWGAKGPYFCTFTKDVESYRQGIEIAKLTSTFRDAVTVTRELGLRYLWIDSICIIQKDASGEGDFQQEAERMESVFSSAYCVLAASSAREQSDGFLNDRKGSHRQCVTFKHHGQPPFYVCRFIDDFENHVLEAPLSTRGWVLQERVLAHRTIYFTDHQTYWECGEGVRGETFMRMQK